MYVQDKGLKYSLESVKQALIERKVFRFNEVTKGRDQQFINELAEEIAQDVVLIADCIRIQAETKTTRIFLTIVKETQKSIALNLNYISPDMGVGRLYITGDKRHCYGAMSVKITNYSRYCFFSGSTGVPAAGCTDVFFKLVRDLTGVYCQYPEIL